MKLIHQILVPALLTGPLASAAPLEIRAISSLELAGSEISAFDPASKRVFVTSNIGLQIVDLTDPSAPTLVSTVDFTAAPINLDSTDVTSVAVHNGTVAVAVPNSVKENKGHVVFLNAADASWLSTVEVGVLPDHVTFTPDGAKVLTADEGEMLPTPVGTGSDPAPGTVTIIDVSGGFAAPTAVSVDFTAFDAQAQELMDAGVRIFDDGTGNLKLPSIDFEPEYLAISADSALALVTLQEANAIALLDIAAAAFTAIVPLGEKDFSGLLADFSDRDGPANGTAINLTRGNPVFGLYMPDAIASYTVGGETWYVIANEGDDRGDFMTNPEESIRVGNNGYILDPTVFPNAAELKANSRLGRLTVSNSPGLRGDIDGDGDIDRILAYGGRSFSILDSTGAMVYDSGDLLERATANIGAPWFDDERSDNKAAEPEGITTGVVDGRTYAFVGLERSRAVMAFDVTDPSSVSPAGFGTHEGDENPEGLTFVTAADSPNGEVLLIVTNETSNTLTIFAVKPVAYTLQLLHLSDGEAGLLASQTAPNLAALVDAFDGAYPNTLILTGGDNFIPSPFLNAGTDPSLSAIPGIGATAFARPDIAIHNAIGVEASAIGNHEWDLGSNVFADAIRPSGAWIGAQFPHISANLDFSGDPAANAAFTDVPLDGTASAIPDALDRKGRIVPTAVITKGGERIGLVGVTTQLIESISSPSGTEVKGFPTGPGPNGEVEDMDLLASQVQPYIDELAAEGVNKIVLLSHLQQIENERSLATKLSGVDIILAAGSNTRLGDADDTPFAFPGHAADFDDTYPIVTAGLNGEPTLIVNTDNEFTYIGRLVVDFDAEGVLILSNLAVHSLVNGAYASTEENVAAAWGVAAEDLATTAFAAGTKGAAVSAITSAVQAVIADKDGEVFGYTSVYLEGERSFVRSEETNFGNITADANAGALRFITGGTAPIVSLKNGGGIRAQIGAVSGSAEKLPPQANPAIGKPEGGISRLDIENALRFDNKLIAFETTPEGLKNILEHGVAAWPNQGRFPQVGGVSFSWDPALPSGSRLVSISLIDDNGDPVAAIVSGGELVENAPETIAMITLNFLANNGDGYPMKANGENFRYLLADGTLGPVLDEEEDFTIAPSLPDNPVGEQEVFALYLADRHGTPATAYTIADTIAASDTRIQNLEFRPDEVLPYTADQLATLNTYADPLRTLGLSPVLAITAPQVIAGIDALIVAAGNTGRAAGLAEGLAEGHAAGVVEGHAAGLAEGRVEGHAAGVVEGHAAGHTEGLAEGTASGLAAGRAEGLVAGIAAGRAEGFIAGRTEGFAEGRTAGLVEGRSEGLLAGIATGITTGHATGLAEGLATGRTEGLAEGRAEGLIAGRAEVTSNPSDFDLYTVESIQDLRGAGNLLIKAENGEVVLSLPIEKSTTLEQGSWLGAGELRLVLPIDAGQHFYRLILPQ